MQRFEGKKLLDLLTEYRFGRKRAQVQPTKGMHECSELSCPLETKEKQKIRNLELEMLAAARFL